MRLWTEDRRNEAIAAGVIGTAAAGLRLAALRWAPPIEGDAVEYLALARNLVRTHTFTSDGVTPASYRPPLYPAFLAVFDWIGVDEVRWALIVQCILGGLTVAMICALGRRVATARVATTAAVALAIAPMTVRYASTVLTETLFVFLIVAASLAWAYSRAWTCGLCLGLAVLTRASLWPFVVLLLAVGVTRRRAMFVHIAVSTTMVVAPWMVRNVAHTGRATIADAGWGANLLLGTIPVHTGSNVWAQLTAAVPASGTGSSEGEVAARAEALRRIRRDPWSWIVARIRQYPWLFLDNGVYLPLAANNTTFREALRSGGIATIGIKASFILGNLAVFVAAAAGAWQARSRMAALAPVWAIPLFFAVAHLPMLVEPRYGLPLEPYLLVLAAIAVTREGGVQLHAATD